MRVESQWMKAQRFILVVRKSVLKMTLFNEIWHVMWHEFVHSFFVISTPCIFFGENNREHSPFQHEAVLQYRFFSFFAEPWVHATLLIIVRLCSNLRCWIVHYLSFLEKKTELIYLHYRPFYNCLSFVFDFLAKKCPKRCAHC